VPRQLSGVLGQVAGVGRVVYDVADYSIGFPEVWKTAKGLEQIVDVELAVSAVDSILSPAIGVVVENPEQVECAEGLACVGFDCSTVE